MKLDVDVLRYLSKDEFRVLTAVEMGMKNVTFAASNPKKAFIFIEFCLPNNTLVCPIAQAKNMVK
jgi:hypothetical protein